MRQNSPRSFLSSSSMLILPLTLMVSCLVSCGAGSSNGTPVRFKNPLKPGGKGGGGDQISGKPVPAMINRDRLLTAFQELARGERRVRNLITPPGELGKSKKQGCITFFRVKAPPSGAGLLSTAHYNGCKFSQTQSAESIPLEFIVGGNETYQAVAASEKAKAFRKVVATLNVAVFTSSPRARIGSTTLKREADIEEEAKQGDRTSYVGSMVGEWGDSSQIGSDWWKSEMDSAHWTALTTGALNLESGSKIDLTYRSAVAKKMKAATPIQLSLEAIDTIEFGSPCPWPVKGAFTWTETNPKTGQPDSGEILFQKDGYTDGEGNNKVSWPKTQCLENQ